MSTDLLCSRCGMDCVTAANSCAFCGVCVEESSRSLQMFLNRPSLFPAGRMHRAGGIILLLIFLSAGCAFVAIYNAGHQKNEASTHGSAPSDSAALKSGEQADPAKEAAIPEEIQHLLTEWQSATLARDPLRVAHCYLPSVDVYFRKRNVDRSQIQKAEAVLFQQYTSIVQYQLSDFRFEPLDAETAQVTFRKAWDVRGADAFIGREREQLILKRTEDGWKIASEQELQVFKAVHVKQP